MIEYAVGDILVADVEAIVNPVNCVGVMGRGLALQFKKAFPGNFAAYGTACRDKQVQPGRMFVFENRHVDGLQYIINFPTKRHWRDHSSLEDIEAGLLALRIEVQTRQIQSIAIPPPGCGLGGLNWAVVRPRIESVFLDLPDVQTLIFCPTEIETSVCNS